MTMKKLLLLFTLALALVTALPAQETAPAEAPKLTAAQLDQLLGPIALYPDALIALILPASTASADLVLASRYLQGGNDPAGVDDQPWDDSVRSLAHYPEVVKWMDQNLAWTKQLGDAFLAQPADVMQAVQRLRATARAAGTLTDTPQQQVIMAGDALCIVPVQPDVIYVPAYDPAVVYLARPEYDNEPFLTFGVGFSIGPWLSFDLDWGHQRIWFVDRGDRERYWREHRDWRHPNFPGRPGYVRDPDRHPWKPAPDHPRPPPPDLRRPRPDIIRPTPFSGAPPRPTAVHLDSPQRRPDNRDLAPRADPNQPDARPSRPPVAANAAPVSAPPSAPPQPPPSVRRGASQAEPVASQTTPAVNRGREFRGDTGSRPPPTNAPASGDNARATRAPRQPPPSLPTSAERGAPPSTQVRPPPPPPAAPTAPAAAQPAPAASDDDRKKSHRGSD